MMFGTVREVMADSHGRNYFIEGEDGRVYFGQERDLADIPRISRGMDVEFISVETSGKNKQPRAVEIKLKNYTSECMALYRNKKPKPWNYSTEKLPKKSGWYWAKQADLPTVYPAYYFSEINEWLTVTEGVANSKVPFIWRKMRFSDEFKEE